MPVICSSGSDGQSDNKHTGEGANGDQNAWEELLQDFIDSFDDITVDRQLCVCARLYQAGMKAKANELWARMQRNDHAAKQQFPVLTCPQLFRFS